MCTWTASRVTSQRIRHLGERRVGRLDASVAGQQFLRVGAVATLSQREGNPSRLSRLEVDPHVQGGAGIEPRADVARERVARHGGGA